MLAILVCAAMSAVLSPQGDAQGRLNDNRHRSFLVFDNWNTLACGMTDTAAFHLDRAVHGEQIQMWYRWRTRESVVAYTLARDGRTLLSGTLTRGGCDPYQEAWCTARVEFDLDLGPGDYAVRAAHPRICQNAESHGNGFVKVQASERHAGGPDTAGAPAKQPAGSLAAAAAPRTVASPPPASPATSTLNAPIAKAPALQSFATAPGEGSATAEGALAALEHALRTGSVSAAIKVIHPIKRSEYRQLFGSHPGDLPRLAAMLASRVAREVTAEDAEFVIYENGKPFTVDVRRNGDLWFVYEL